MKNKFTKSAWFLGLGMLFVALTIVACHKNTECTAVIHVVDDASGLPVVGAEVKLWADMQPPNKPGQVENTQITGSSGSTTHVFKLPAIFNIDVNYPTGGQTGKGIVQLEIGETVEKTVRIK